MSIVAAIVTRFWRRRQYFGQTRFPHCSPRRLLIIKVITLMQCGDPLFRYRFPSAIPPPPYLESDYLKMLRLGIDRHDLESIEKILFRCDFRGFLNGWKIIGSILEETSWRKRKLRNIYSETK